jgi:hypothetical protein
VAGALQLIVCRLLFGVQGSQLAAGGWWLVACVLWFAICSLHFVVVRRLQQLALHGLWLVICCLLLAVCCLLFVAWCCGLLLSL